MDVKELDRVKESSPAIIAVTSSSSPSLFLNTTSNKNDNDEEDVCQDQLDDSSSSPSNDVISALNVEVDTKGALIPQLISCCAAVSSSSHSLSFFKYSVNIYLLAACLQN